MPAPPPLQIRRGLLSALPTGASGEPLWATDTKNLYISDGAGTNLIQGSANVLTNTRIPFADSNGKLTDSANMVWDGTTHTITGYTNTGATSTLTSGTAYATVSTQTATPSATTTATFRALNASLVVNLANGISMGSSQAHANAVTIQGSVSSGAVTATTINAFQNNATNAVAVSGGASFTISSLVGGSSNVNTSGAGATSTNAVGHQVTVSGTGASSVTGTAIGYQIVAGSWTGTVTTDYGIFCANLGNANVDRACGIAVAEQTGSNRNACVVLGQTASPSGNYILYIITATATTKPVFVKLAASHSANAVEIQDSNGKVIGGRDSSAQPFVQTANGAVCALKSTTETITLSTSGTTTDSSANLLPANSLIVAVVARITTTITTATDWKMGDATTADRFTAANATRTSGTTDYGFRHQQGSVTTDAAGPVQTTAAKLRITTTGTPGAGAVEVTVFYIPLTAPTS